MNNSDKLNGTWLRASVLGCIWAASEIVFGSFLHNLRIPFTGNIMTGIAIILLISVSYLWDMKGLFWRAGLICALMKSISPSAVLFGPMIAICCEAFLLELSVRIAGRNIIGYLIGGMLAMLWNLFQFIMTYIIFYGPDIVGLYNKIAIMTSKQLNIHSNGGWFPIIALALLDIVLGSLAVIVGIYIGRRLKNKPAGCIHMPAKSVMQRQQTYDIRPFGFSLFWLLFSIAAMIAELCLIGFSTPWLWVTAGSLLIVAWLIRYRNSLRPLRKPKFWISFIVITLLMSWLYSGIKNGELFSFTGLAEGLQMNFRAALMIIGFAAIGKELVNPVIKNFFSGSHFRQLACSLEVAFDTLPLVIANLPGVSDILRKPFSTLKNLVGQADSWLDKVSLQFSEKPFVIIISGQVASGKSSLLSDLVQMLKTNQVPMAGFIAKSVYESEKKAGYDIYDVEKGERYELARTYGDDTMPFVGRFYFRPMGLEAGNAILEEAAYQLPEWVIIDEIGPWEMMGQGWAYGLNRLLGNTSPKMIWVVREGILNDVMNSWRIEKSQVFRSDINTADEIYDFISRLKIQVVKNT